MWMATNWPTFCLGDTGAMFGHSPDVVVNALCEQAARGFTAMLASKDAAAVVGRLWRNALACRCGNLP
jgi:glutamate-1-semialdehyde 2,1-aminomutase